MPGTVPCPTDTAELLGIYILGIWNRNISPCNWNLQHSLGLVNGLYQWGCQDGCRDTAGAGANFEDACTLGHLIEG